MIKILKILTLLFTLFFLNACFWLNERGISTRYYNDCKDSFDAFGNYQKECNQNFIEWNK